MLLFVDNERAPFFDKNIQRFRRKEFQERLFTMVIIDPNNILSKFVKTYVIQVPAIGTSSKLFNFCLLRMFCYKRLNCSFETNGNSYR